VELRQLLQMHARHTESRKVLEILADFEAWLPRFRAVISDEYLDYLSARRSRAEGAGALEGPAPARSSARAGGDGTIERRA
jgi:glutamate synthase domain-containing protein 3